LWQHPNPATQFPNGRNAASAYNKRKKNVICKSQDKKKHFSVKVSRKKVSFLDKHLYLCPELNN